MVGSSEQAKKNRKDATISQPQLIPYDVPRMYGIRGVLKSGFKWYISHDKMKYNADQFINRENLLKEFPSMVRRIKELHIQFLFDHPTECNLRLAREFYTY